MADEEKQEASEAPEETPDTVSEPSAQEQQAEAAAVEQPEPSAEQQQEPAAEEQPAPAAEQQQEPAAEEQPAPAVTSEGAADVAATVEGAPAEASKEAGGASSGEADEDGDEEPTPRGKPSVPGAHLEVDIVPEGVDPLGPSEAYEDPYAIEDEDAEQGPKSEQDESEEGLVEPISTAAIDLASGARYRATGKRKTAIARVTLRPGTGTYLVNGRVLEEHFPRVTLQRNIRQPLETVGYQERMDVVARLHGGGISAQAGALRHGVSRALLEADPNLRGELKRRGFLTRDSRAKERKKAGLKKARKRPQFSKR
jgi:small subunit ribosomal protein S9